MQADHARNPGHTGPPTATQISVSAKRDFSLVLAGRNGSGDPATDETLSAIAASSRAGLAGIGL